MRRRRARRLAWPRGEATIPVRTSQKCVVLGVISVWYALWYRPFLLLAPRKGLEINPIAGSPTRDPRKRMEIGASVTLTLP